jgi:hypothetical protein
MEHTDIKINQVVVTYLNDDQVSRPPAPPIVSPCNSIMSCFAFLFLGAYQADLLDRRPICCHVIIRDAGSRHEGCRDCGEGATKGQT